jgi:hypothetical protein
MRLQGNKPPAKVKAARTRRSQYSYVKLSGIRQRFSADGTLIKEK